MNENIRGHNLLLIGSGCDLNGRRLGKQIDSGKFGLVCRINKPYGLPADVGTRTDVIITRWSSWVKKFFGTDKPTCPCVILNEHLGFSVQEHLLASLECGVTRPSAGILAICWALNRGAARVRVIGFGYDARSGWANQKIYASGELDANPLYDWDREHKWIQRHAELL